LRLRLIFNIIRARQMIGLAGGPREMGGQKPGAAAAPGPRATTKSRRGRKHSLTALVAHAHSLLIESFLGPLRAKGLSATEVRLLVALAEADGVGATELSRSELFKLATVTKALGRMERAQLVRRSIGDHDRRLVLVHLTPRGRSVAGALAQRSRRQHGRVKRALGPDAERRIRAALTLLITRLPDLAAEAPAGATRRSRRTTPGAGEEESPG
jgi:MarR family transcriptional regulator, organic hydroperoxide resistance regulator